VESLDPIANLTNLESLYLLDLDGPYRRIDPSKLKQLTKLKKLTVARFRDLQSLDWVAGMTELRSLRLGGVSKITDLSPLYGLEHLEELYLPDGTTFDMSLFEKLPKLDFERCGITRDQNWEADSFNGWEEMYEAGFQSFEHLDELNLSGSNFERVSSWLAKNLGGYKTIDLSHTPISDISFLRHAKSLKSIDLSHTRVKDLSVLKALPELESAKLRGCDIADISDLRGVEKLRWLDLGETKVSDLSPLRDSILLRSISIAETEVQDLSPLAKLYRLRAINLTGLKVDDIEWIKSLRFLKYLYLTRTKVRDHSPLQNLHLLHLRLCDTPVTDLSPLSKQTDLTDMRLSGSAVKDISALQPSRSLKHVDFNGLKLDDATLVFSLPKRTLQR